VNKRTPQSYGPPPKLDISREQLDELAALGLELSQRELPDVATPAMMTPYKERPENVRANMRAGVYRVLQALVILGWIERP
jgi:hypothetical protein